MFAIKNNLYVINVGFIIKQEKQTKALVISIIQTTFNTKLVFSNILRTLFVFFSGGGGEGRAIYCKIVKYFSCVFAYFIHLERSQLLY